jgi:two-component system, cell cycle response regulator
MVAPQASKRGLSPIDPPASARRRKLTKTGRRHGRAGLGLTAGTVAACELLPVRGGQRLLPAHAPAPHLTTYVEDLWEGHFRDPKEACARATALLAGAEPADGRASAWARLTIGYHHLHFTLRPTEAGDWLAQARAQFVALGERRGELLARVGIARLMIVEDSPLAARDRLLELYPEAEKLLPPQDRFWVASALGAAYFFTNRIDEAIRHLYDGLEVLRTMAPSPPLPAVMSSLAAALVVVGDYEPARELAQDALGLLPHFNNPQLQLSARTSLAESLLALDKPDLALAEVDAMLGIVSAEPGVPPQNHCCAVAAETYALHDRYDDASHCVAIAQTIRDRYPGGYNEVHCRWAAAVLAAARGPDNAGIAALLRAVDAAESAMHAPTICKAHERLARRYAALGRFDAAYRHQRRLTEAQMQRLSNRAHVKYYLLKVQHELQHARVERDRADRQRQETLALNGQLERLNAELHRKVREIESLQSQLAAEAMQDPLTGLFNRRYLDAAMPGLLATARRRREPLAVALVDLDHFKRINDRFGHPAGDAVLVRIGELFTHALRSSDAVCRYGGEEFCVALPETDAAGAVGVLSALAAQLRELAIRLDGHSLAGLTFSAGVAVFPSDGQSFASLVASADRALYAAKGGGRDRVQVATGTPLAHRGRLRRRSSAA